MSEKEIRSLSQLFLEQTTLACEKDFAHLVEQDSAARYGDAYAKYVDAALTRLEGMVNYAECLLQDHAALMTIIGILSKWRNRLQAVRDCKEHMRVFARSERDIVKAFREFSGKCVEMADKLSEENPEARHSSRTCARYYKEGGLKILCDLYIMPELYEISDRYPIHDEEEGEDSKTTAATRKQEKSLSITVEMTEKEARAYLAAEQKIRSALTSAEPAQTEE